MLDRKRKPNAFAASYAITLGIGLLQCENWRHFGDKAAVQRCCPRTVEPQKIHNHLSSCEKTGAGEGIRTLDPNLGKVVLYP
jgi:hypothetical protein